MAGFPWTLDTENLHPQLASALAAYQEILNEKIDAYGIFMGPFEWFPDLHSSSSSGLMWWDYVRHGEGNRGVYYAALIDFDGNGIPELFVAYSYTNNGETFWKYKIYGFFGEVKLLHSDSFSYLNYHFHVTPTGHTELATSADGNVYLIAVDYSQVHVALGTGGYSRTFWTIRNGEWVSELSIYSYSGEDADWNWIQKYYINDVEVSHAEFDNAPYSVLGIIETRQVPLYSHEAVYAVLAELEQGIIIAAQGHSQPSTWAESYVTAAIAAGLVPEALQSHHTQNITRAEFARLAVTLYEYITGEEIAGRVRFHDTRDINVERAAYIGVVTGVGDGNFAPERNLTREQAAVMLSRLAYILEQPLPAQAATFADNAQVSDWAADAVGQMQATGIMGGIGDNRFAPQGAYTREQSIITIMRLLEFLG